MLPHRQLIHWMYVEIAPVDTAAIATALAYDDDYREPVRVDGNADGIGTSQRKESATVTLKAQIERDRDELQRLSRSGDIPDSSIGLVFSVRELEAKSLVAADGTLGIKKNDRLVRILNRAGVPTETFDRVPLYATHVRRLTSDLYGTSNFVVAIFEDRRTGIA